jgi:hypothetical protein
MMELVQDSMSPAEREFLELEPMVHELAHSVYLVQLAKCDVEDHGGCAPDGDGFGLLQVAINDLEARVRRLEAEWLEARERIFKKPGSISSVDQA